MIARGDVAAARGGGELRLRAWLEHVAQTAIDWLDALDAPTEDLEDSDVPELADPEAHR